MRANKIEKGRALSLGIAVAIIGIFLAVLLLMWFLTFVDIEIIYEKDEEKNKSDIIIKYLFFKKRIDSGKKKDKSRKKEKNDQKEKKGIEYYKSKINLAEELFNELKDDIVEILRFSRERMIKIKKLDFSFNFGLDDPMETGVVNGLIYALCYNILGIIHQNSYIEKSNINITPDFENVCGRICFHCILRMKNVHITVVIIKAIKVYYKFKRVTKAIKERK